MITSKNPFRSQSLGNLVMLLVVISFALFYLINISLPDYMLFLTGKKAMGQILKIEKEEYSISLEFSYFNKYENKEYFLVKQLDKAQLKKLNSIKDFKVGYPKFFPKNIYIENVDYRSTFLLQVLFHVLGLYGIVIILKEIVIRLKLLK